MSLVVLATAFVLILPVELPDKTFVATLVLATRYRPLPVWVGVSAAFLVQSLVAVTAGGLLSLLPETLVVVVAASMFALGALVLWRGARPTAELPASGAAEVIGAADAEREPAGRPPGRAGGVRVAATSFGVLFVAEWGDLSQLLAAGLAARYDDPVSVLVGSWAALVTVAGLAVLLGRVLLRRARLSTIRRIGAALCAVLTAVAAYDLVTRLG